MFYTADFSDLWGLSRTLSKHKQPMKSLAYFTWEFATISLNGSPWRVILQWLVIYCTQLISAVLWINLIETLGSDSFLILPLSIVWKLLTASFAFFLSYTFICVLGMCNIHWWLPCHCSVPHWGAVCFTQSKENRWSSLKKVCKW